MGLWENLSNCLCLRNKNMADDEQADFDKRMHTPKPGICLNCGRRWCRAIFCSPECAGEWGATEGDDAAGDPASEPLNGLKDDSIK